LPADKFTEEAQREIVTALRLFATYEQAAEFAGVSERCLRNWLKSKDRKFADFQEKVRLARSQPRNMLVGTVLKSAQKGDWRSAAWMLERRYPKEFGYKVTQELSGPDGGPIQTSTTGVVMLPPVDDMPRTENGVEESED
jgi:hypothetical protein